MSTPDTTISADEAAEAMHLLPLMAEPIADAGDAAEQLASPPARTVGRHRAPPRRRRAAT